jgi:uncharacterized protein (DUF433 family)
MGLFSAGWTTEKVLSNYHQLTKDDLSAVFGFAAESLEGQSLVTFDADVA